MNHPTHVVWVICKGLLLWLTSFTAKLRTSETRRTGFRSVSTMPRCQEIGAIDDCARPRPCTYNFNRFNIVDDMFPLCLRKKYLITTQLNKIQCNSIVSLQLKRGRVVAVFPQRNTCDKTMLTSAATSPTPLSSHKCSGSHQLFRF